MAANVIEAQPRGSSEFVESSVLEAVVPENLDTDISKALSSWGGAVEHEGDSILPFLVQRHVLFLGMFPVSDLIPHVSYLCVGV